MKQIEITLYTTPVGDLIVGSFGDFLCMCDWQTRKNRAAIDKRLTYMLDARFVENSNPVLRRATAQLDQYFALQRTEFDIPLMLNGTPFQKRVWHNLTQIAYGDSCSYLALADRVQNNRAVRAVANANGANALSIFIPCHRIIGTNGSLVGYAGGLKAKEYLLQLERGP